MRDRDRAEGLVTGYYEPLLHGSLKRTDRFTVPLYLRPPELVDVDLGAFRDDLRGRRLAGVVRGGRLVPFADRAGVDAGALSGRKLELLWVDDAIDAFFLHIQGSGRIELPDGKHLRVGYSAQNGHPYVAIGRELVALGVMKLEDVTMQSIRAWLEQHPERALEIMRKNPSFVFFRKLDGAGPVGSAGVTLEPYRSIAVDTAFMAMGAPVWLEGTWPAPRPDEPDRPLRRLVVAQDTGGAIRGPLRADLFCGHGDEAAEVAGRLTHQARMWLLLPKETSATAADESPQSSSAGVGARVDVVELSEADLDAFERGFAKEIELVLAAMKKGAEATTPEERGEAEREALQERTAPEAARAVGLTPDRYLAIREPVTTVLETLDLRGDIAAPMAIDPAQVTPELRKRLDGDPFASLSPASATAVRARLDRLVPLWTRYVVLGAMAG
jgi:membrane-bound lytic murein transglycosylase